MTDDITDREIIKALGGPKEMALLLGYAGRQGQWRVNNWVQRGIPAIVKLARHDLIKLARKILLKQRNR